jgi:hypothetical protein
MRRFTALVLALGAMLVLAAPVAAGRPDRSYAGDIDDFTLEGVCAFPVLVHVPVNREYFLTTDRFTLLTGSLWVDLTNAETRTIRLNISGPARYGDASTAYGAYLGWLDGVEDSLTLFHGRIDVDTNNAVGKRTPVCPMLAP